MSGQGSLTDRELVVLLRRHLGVYDDLVYGVLEAEARVIAAREGRGWRRLQRELRKRPGWWYSRKHDWWRFWRVHEPALVDWLDARRKARWERRQARRRDGLTVALAELRSARWVLSAVRFRIESREAFACSDPLDPGYVGRFETSLLRDRRERGGEWA